MRTFFAVAFVVMIVWSFAMLATSTRKDTTGQIPVVWTSDDNPLRKQQVELFRKLHPNLNLTLDPANESMDKVIVQSIGGIGPDVFDCRDANQLAAYVKSGVALDVTDELKKRGVDVGIQTWPAMLPISTYEGRTYGVPTNIGANALWANPEILGAANLALPKGEMSWADFIPIAQKLTKRDEKGRVMQAGFLFDWYLWPHFVAGFGGQVFSPDGKRCVLDSTEVVQAIQLMQDLVYKYKVTPSPVEEASMAGQGGWGAGNINLFGAKRGAFALGGRWWLANLRTFPGLKLRVIPSPTGGVKAYGAVGRATLVNANSPHREAAIDFLAYLASKQYNELVNDQADGLCPFTQFATGPRFQHNPQYPGEVDNEVWREASQYSVPNEGSPFVNGHVASRLIEKQIDLVRIGEKNAKDAMTEAARQVNEQIALTLAKDPALRKRYEGSKP